jgi:hypothetical protein
MEKIIIHKILENLNGYLISINRNFETEMYELEVGFKKNWVFKSNDNIECSVEKETDSGSLVIISGKHDEVVIDDLVQYVNKVIETNKKITEMQERFEEELKRKKEQLEEEVFKFQEEIDKYKDTSLSTQYDEDVDEDDEEEVKEIKKTTNKKTKELSIEENKIAQKIS